MRRSSLVVAAGNHDRWDCPFWFDAPDGLGETFSLVAPDGTSLPAQRFGARAVAILPSLAAGEERSYAIATADAAPAASAPRTPALTVARGDGALEVAADARHFATYNVAADQVRPYVYPLHGPTGRAMTRNFPMRPNVPGESTDHVHHRGLYVAFGAVNGVDIWTEAEHHGRIAHVDWDAVASGPVGVELRERLRWEASDGRDLLTEARRIVLFATESARYLDFEIELAPAGLGPVLFGDTKEGGPLAIRVPTPMEGRRRGRITNAYGGVSEAETWGKRAPWVDYSGAIEGEEVGVAIFDHPTSFRHPTYWHVRDYGLFCPNPFGVAAFTGDPSRRGDHLLLAGQRLTFRYRVYLHTGGAAQARVADRYNDYATPPAAKLEG